MKLRKEITNTIAALNKGATILYPTDTVWGIGCDATNEIAVEKIYAIKQRNKNKSLLILVNDFEMLQKYIPQISENVKLFLAKQTKPTTVIYTNPIGLAQNTIAKDDTIAIRIVKNNFCSALIKEFGKPIISTSANISGSNTPINFKTINTKIINAVDYVVSVKNEQATNKSSKIIKFVENKIIILRK